MKKFVMLKKVSQNIILLIINQNRPNILLITKEFSSYGIFYLILQSIAEHAKT